MEHERKDEDKEKLDEVLQDVSQISVEFTEQLNEAIEKIQDMDLSAEIPKFTDDALQSLSQDGVDPQEEIKQVLDKIRMDTGYGVGN